MDYFIKALNNDTITINEYLRYGDVNIVDSNNLSLLHYASKGGAMEVGEILINNFINVNILDNNGESPIFYAVRSNQFGFFKMLVRSGASLDIINKNNESLLMIAYRFAKDEFISLLTDKQEFDFKAINNNQENLLFLALYANKTNQFIDIASKYPELLFAKDCHSRNLLMISLKYRNDTITKYLIEKGIKLYELDNEHNNSMFYAAKYSDCDIIKYLLELKPIIEGKNLLGNTIFEIVKENPFGVSTLFTNYSMSYDYVMYKKTYPEFVAVITKNYDLLEALRINKQKRDVYGTSLNDLIKQVNDQNINNILK